MENNTLTAFYDLNVSHPSFDFMAFLTSAETARRRRGLDALHMVIVPADRNIRPVLFFSETHESWRIHNILVPACRFIEAVKSFTICTSKDEAEDLFEAAGERVHPADYAPSQPAPPPIPRAGTCWQPIWAMTFNISAPEHKRSTTPGNGCRPMRAPRNRW